MKKEQVNSPQEGFLFLTVTPHVHIHQWTSEEECKQVGYIVTELCCHGCHASLLVYHGRKDMFPQNGFPALKEVCNQFQHIHRGCNPEGLRYEAYCSALRFNTDILDLRGVDLNISMNKEYQSTSITY